MKKFYLLIAAAFASASLYANAPKNLTISTEPLPAELQQALVEAGIMRINADQSISIKSEALDLNANAFEHKATPFKAAKKSVAPKTVTETSWTDLGTGKFVDPLLSMFGASSQTISVKMQKGASGEYYRIEEPYSGYSSNGYSAYISSNEGSEFLFDATDPNKVTMDIAYDVATLQSTLASLGTISIINKAAYYIASGDADKLTDDCYGTLADDVITFPSGSMFVNFSNYNSTSLYSLGEVTFSLPSGTEVTVTSEACTNGSFTYSCSLDKNVATAKLSILPYYCTSSTELYEYINQSSATIEFSSSFTETIDPATDLGLTEHQMLSFICIGLDGSGNVISGDISHTFYQPDESSKWKSIGKGKYADGFLYGFFNNVEATENEVEIEESITNPGYLRVVNPMVTDWPDYSDGDHDHYLYIDATDADAIYIEPQSLGLVTSYGQVYVASVSYSYAAYDEEVPSKYLAAWDRTTNEITFADSSLIIALEEEEDGAWMLSNYGGGFKLTLPADYQAGVKDVIAGENSTAAVEYFNLQGVRIANPTAGQLVIRRQGNNVTKTVVR